MGFTSRDKVDIEVSVAFGVGAGLLVSWGRYESVLTYVPTLFAVLWGAGAVLRVRRKERAVARRLNDN
ncbi:hypothetical protein [Isoptericola sp. NPDC057391]|uniref:hypothetical protein n=1 Tax=Isoptericola sp. NPDC057391 TaxID=3346117 RepID=UPI00363A944E